MTFFVVIRCGPENSEILLVIHYSGLEFLYLLLVFAETIKWTLV